MSRRHPHKQLVLLTLMLLLQVAKISPYKRNYEAKYTNVNVPLWKQRACEKAQKYKANSHYICDDKGNVKCLPGWQGDLCQVPMCRRGCDPMNGYCQRPGECRCRIGYTGELCDKCIPLPGCQHGDCTKPFECICLPGWDGLFCTEPTCRPGCHNTRGYCDAPGECRCRIGWAGRNCSDCSVLPGCQHGTCAKPLECQCLAGYTGLLCQTPICNEECHKQHGYCKKPGECRCKVGWTGSNCDKCFPYPGCVNGDCEKPWECNCKSGWGGILCDEELTYCAEHPDTCENNGKCISLTKEDGSYRCHCKQGFLGKNCEIIDEFLLTSTTAPRITPPSLADWSGAEEEDDIDSESNDLESALNFKVKENSTINEAQQETKPLDTTNALPGGNETLSLLNNTDSLMKVTRANGTELREEHLGKSKENKIIANSTVAYISLSTVAVPAIKNGIDAVTSNETDLQSGGAAVAKSQISSTEATIATIDAIATASKSSNITSTIPPLSKLDDEKNLHTLPLKPAGALEKPEQADDEDEECTDDNDDECEYVDEEEDEDDDDDDDDDF